MLTDVGTVRRAWVVIASKPRKEDVAAAVFSREGYEAYCPKLLNRRFSKKLQPLFPGYLFVWVSPKVELPSVCRFPGVLKALVFGSQVACVEPEIVERWKEREGGRGYLTPEPPPPFEVGQKVRFREGAFVGLEATVLENLPARDRVRVLLDYLGASFPVEADRDLLG
jgi:transcriptional antiterminator RfaH